MNNTSMFYCYRQHNSGKHWVINENVTINVIIEANSTEDADNKAKKLGIYFNGVNQGVDCSCCGDRWDDSEGYSATTRPDSFIRSAAHYDQNNVEIGQPYCYVYSLNGHKNSLYREQ